MASTGSEIFVFGGIKPSKVDYPERYRNDGAILDLATRRWTRMASAPFSPRVRPSAVWTGSELVVLGVACIEESELEGELRCGGRGIFGAVYARDKNTWRALPLPAEYEKSGNSPSIEPLAWTGSEALFSINDAEYVAVDPQDGRIRNIEQPQLNGPAPDGYTCVAGKHVVVAEDGTYVTPRSGVRLLTLDPQARRWSESPEIHQDLEVSGVRPACTRRSVVVARADLSLIERFDFATGRWSSVDPPELRPAFECVYSVGCDRYWFSGHGDVVDFWRPDQHGFRYNTVDDTWSRIVAGPDVPTGSRNNFIWGDGLAATYSARTTTADTGAQLDKLVLYHPSLDDGDSQTEVLLNFETGQVVASDLNGFIINEQPQWARDAGSAAAHMMHLDDPQQPRATVDEQRDGSNRTVVTLTFNIDTSTVRYRLVFQEALDGYVRFVDGAWGQRCIPSQDDDDFSTQPCTGF